MSTFSYYYDERLCRICKGYDRQDNLHYYAFRQYAHPQCMVEKYGHKQALMMVREWGRPEFKRMLKRPIVKGREHPLSQSLRKLKEAHGGKK